MSDEMVKQWQEYVENLGALLAQGRRDDALALFMRLAGSTEEDIASARGSKEWEASAGLFDEAADALVASMPLAERKVVPVSSHVADPLVVAPILREFFS